MADEMAYAISESLSFGGGSPWTIVVDGMSPHAATAPATIATRTTTDLPISCRPTGPRPPPAPSCLPCCPTLSIPNSSDRVGSRHQTQPIGTAPQFPQLVKQKLDVITVNAHHRFRKPRHQAISRAQPRAHHETDVKAGQVHFLARALRWIVPWWPPWGRSFAIPSSLCPRTASSSRRPCSGRSPAQPDGLLHDSPFPGKLPAADTFPGRGHQIRRQERLVDPDFRLGEHGAGAHRELLSAVLPRVLDRRRSRQAPSGAQTRAVPASAWAPPIALRPPRRETAPKTRRD